MSLVQKNITHPNELIAMGLGGVPASQESINNAVKDIHNSLIEAGLTVVLDNTQLDINNIPNLNLNIERTKNIYNAGEFCLSLGYIYYYFSDNQQDNYPIVIKLEYGFINASKSQVTFNSFGFAIRINITSGSSKLVENDILCNIAYQSSADNGGYSMKNKIINVGSPTIEVAYNGNSLYLNIFPKRLYIGELYYDVYKNSLPSEYISFYLERQLEGVQYIKLCAGVYDSVNIQGAEVPQKKYISNISNIHLVNRYVSNDGIKIPFYPLTLTGNYIDSSETNFISFQTMFLNNYRTVVSNSENFLLGYSTTMNYSNLVTIENKKYVCRTQHNNVNYLEDKNYGLLFRYE